MFSYFDENDYFGFAPSYFPISFHFVQNSDNYPSEWVAFEGIVYAYTPINLCPFSEETINLGSNQVIPFASSYDSIGINRNPSSNCKWTFSINSNQTLKIVFKSLYISDAILQLETDGYLAETYDSNVRPQNPMISYYGSESGIFTLSYDINDTEIYTTFFALISAVDKNPNNPTQICKSNTTGIFTDISNLDYNLGYSAFDSCQYQFPFPQNTEIILNVKKLIVEKNVDFLSLTDQAGGGFVLVKSDTYYLTPDANGTILDFSADGNTQQAGFTVQQTILDCECAPSNVVIPCDIDDSIQITPLPNTSVYCSNMACNFTINFEKTCNETYFVLENYFDLLDNDKAVLISNNKISDTFTSSSDYNKRIFSKTSNISLQFTSGQAPDSIYTTPHSWYIDATIAEPNILPTIQLTEVLPYYVLQVNNLNKNDAFIICSQPNDTLELFISDTSDSDVALEYYALYDSDNMDNFVGDLSSPLISTSDNRYPQHIISSSGCFSVYMAETPERLYLFFRMLKAHSKNCNNTNNVFSLTYDDYTSVFGAANENGNCVITLLAAAAAILPKIKFETIEPSSKDSFKVSSAVNQNTYFVTNSTDENDWKGTTIYAIALSITIPLSQSISVTADLSVKNINLAESGKNGIFASPNYGGYENYAYELYTLNSVGQIYNIELRVQNMDGNGTLSFYNSYQNENITIQQNQTISQNGTNFQLVYENYDNFTFLIQYTTNLLMSITTTTTTTTTTTPMRTTTQTILPTNFTLNSENPYQVFWLDNLPDYGYLSVCTVNDGDALELFVTTGNSLDAYNLYDSNGLYKPVGSAKSLATVLFQRKVQQSENCDSNNVFQAPSSSSLNSTFVVSSFNGNKCEVLFLSSFSELPIVRIGSFLSRYGENDNYIFKSATNNMPLMSINSTDTSNWRNFAIYTNALSFTFTTDISVVLLNGNSEIRKDEKLMNQRGIIVSPSYTGFSTNLIDSNILYQFKNYLEATSKMSAIFSVKSLDKNCAVAVGNNYKNHTFTPSQKYAITGDSFDIFYEQTFTPNSGFLIEYILTPANKNNIVNLNAASPTYVYWLDNLNPTEIITVCSPDSDTLEMFVTKTQSSYTLSCFALYDSNQIDNYVGTLESIVPTSDYRNTPSQFTSISGCFTLQHKSNTVNYLTEVTILFRMRDVHSKNCVGSNVFEVQASAVTISSTASSYGLCEMIILSSGIQNPAIPINSFRSTNSGSITLRSGINQKTLVTIE
uniref:CUB domain-containing protein n=1 Tax=Panagrolaimus sp. ES5 TaxID=591445 RepID=A0AC34FQU6_9BILA